MKELFVLLILVTPAFVLGDTMDEECGNEVYVTDTTTYTVSGSLNDGCVVHFNRQDYGQISLTISGSSLDSLSCQVDVKDGSDVYSKTGGNINSLYYFTRTVNSDSMGSLYLHLGGSSCNQNLLTFTLKLLSSCSDRSQFTCDNGNCVGDYDVCDSWDDCGDNSDESACFWTSGTEAAVTVSSLGSVFIFVTVFIVVYRRRRGGVFYRSFRSEPAVISTSSTAVTQSRW